MPDRLQALDRIALVPLVEQAEHLAAALRRAGATPSGFTSVRPSDMDPLLQMLERMAGLVAELLPPEPSALARRALALVDAVLGDPGGGYDLVRNRLRLVKGRLLIHGERWSEADSAFGDLAFQPHLACDDIGSVRAAMVLDLVVRPYLVRSEAPLAALMLERLLFLLSRYPAAAEQIELIELFREAIAGLLRRPGVLAEVADRSRVPRTALAAFGDFVARPRSEVRGRTMPLRRLARRLLRARASRRLVAALRAAARSRGSFDLCRTSLTRDRRCAPTRQAIITRATGGAGDIATMIPGAVALARRIGEPVHFAVPGGLTPLLRGIPEIAPLATEDEIDLGDFRAWHNFSECPASRAERRGGPGARRPRLEVFAAALGITAADLDEAGWCAPFRLSEAQEKTWRRIRERVRKPGMPLVAVAPFSREEYKGAPALLTALRLLAEECEIIVLHHKRVPLLDATDAHVAETPDLSSLVATIAACDYVVTVDTAHLHIAGALGIPTLAIFGPTDGRLAIKAHKATRLLQPWSRCPLMPCWRHEDSACKVSLGATSSCLHHIEPNDILRAFASLRAEHPLRPALETDATLV